MKILNEVAVIRPILIVVVVLYHAFIVYNGGWKEPVGFVPCEQYKWIARVAYSFMLETFVFISGYVWAFQHIELKRIETFESLVIKKMQRLMLPCLLFGILYQLTLTRNGAENFVAIITNAVQGIAHLWFLPMLFWCFIGAYLLNITKQTTVWRFLLLVLLSLVSYMPLPMQISRSMYYLLFFYSGYVAYRHREQIQVWLSVRRIAILWVAFFSMFFLLSTFDERLEGAETESSMFSAHCAIHSLRRAVQLVYASIGLCASFASALYFVRRHAPSKRIVHLGNYCMGVYIFQQFILQALYFHTSFPETAGSMLLPWMGFVITLPLSLLASYAIRLTKMGRKIL